MIIYKVCNDFMKGVQEFEVKEINNNTFTYEKKWIGKTKEICRYFITNIPNDSYYFKTKKEANEFILKRVESKIISLNKQLIKYENLYNTICTQK